MNSCNFDFVSGLEVRNVPGRRTGYTARDCGLKELPAMDPHLHCFLPKMCLSIAREAMLTASMISTDESPGASSSTPLKARTGDYHCRGSTGTSLIVFCAVNSSVF